LNVEIGDGFFDSALIDMNEQVSIFAGIVASDPNLKDGFNLICHSQGGLIGRGFIERYNSPPVYNFITWASPHQGVYGCPVFNALCSDDICPWLDYFMDLLLAGEWMNQEFQQTFSFASYWKDPFEYDLYVESNMFLADINNEKLIKNETYKKNMLTLNSILLVYSEEDDIVIPDLSPWFYFFANGTDFILTPFNESATYENDFIGLRTLYQQEKMEFVGVPCGHNEIPSESCKPYYDEYTRPYLNNTLPSRISSTNHKIITHF